MLTPDRRTEIATFLKARRTGILPEMVGLPRGRRRRTPGLRREEVATLAGVSTEWYRWLEQARDVRASAEVLQRICHALRLEPSEAQHLLTLAGYGLEELANGEPRPSSVSPTIQRLLDQLGNYPAWAYGERWDILAWNRAATVVHGDFDAMVGIERNGLYQMFLGPRLRRMLVDWEAHARGIAAKARAAHASHVDDPWFNEVIHLLRSRSPEFNGWWSSHLVEGYQDGVKKYDHPEAGMLTFEYTALDIADARYKKLRMTIYVPVEGTGTREAMERVLG